MNDYTLVKYAGYWISNHTYFTDLVMITGGVGLNKHDWVTDVWALALPSID